MSKDILSAASVTKNLGVRLIGRRVIYYPSVTSTNELAKQEARKGAVEGTVVIAGEQTVGKGRLSRNWLTPKGNIALSIILYPDLTHLHFLIMVASLAVVHSIEAVSNLKPEIKWPNDVLINGRKVCGILIESDVQGNRVNYAVIGIGINANLRLADFPELQPIATSLSDELGREVSRLNLVRRLLVEMDRLYSDLQAGKSPYDEWRDRLVTLGKRVRVKAGETVYEGIAESVAEDGSLMLRDAKSSLIKILAGDVTLRE
ncbi:MAG: biotin--[acetyl-CoA-carboxylase] ligase [Chloroflexota bacterium]